MKTFKWAGTVVGHCITKRSIELVTMSWEISHHLTFLKKDNVEGSGSDTSPFMKSQVMASVPAIT